MRGISRHGPSYQRWIDIDRVGGVGYTYLFHALDGDLRQLALRRDMRTNNRACIGPPHGAELFLREKALIAFPVALGRCHAPVVHVRAEHLAAQRLHDQAHVEPSEQIVRYAAAAVRAEGAVVAVGGRDDDAGS